MAFDLSSPVAKLAFEMALKNQQAIDANKQFDNESRAAVSKALSVGNDPLSLYEDVYRQYVDPAQNERRAQAEAFNAYLIGLPELLAQASREGRSTGGGGGGSTQAIDTTNLSGYSTPEESLARIMGMVLPKTPASKATTTPVATTPTKKPGTPSAIKMRRI